MQPLEVTQKVEEEESEEKEGKEEKHKETRKIGVVSMCMNNAGNIIYAGCTDNIIRVYEISEQAA